MDYYSGADIGTGWDPYHQIGGWGSGETQNAAVQQAQMATNLFRQQFKNLIGREPSQSELGAFQTQALTSGINAPGDLSYGDASGLSNSFIQSAFGPEAAQHQQEQQTQQLGKSQTMLQDIINKTMGNTAGQFSDPNSQLYKSFSGQMNNLGISPSSGAFQAGAGSTIAQSGLDQSNAGLQAIGIPGIQNIAGLTSVPYQQSFGSGQDALSHLNQLNDFGLQSELARQLQREGNPSGAQSILGMATGAAGGAGGLLQGGAAAKNATSYVCWALIERGLLCEQDLDDLHLHLMPALFKKARAFWYYAMNGKKLVEAADKAGLKWAHYKKWLFDDVMAEPDPCKAVDEYARACEAIAMRCEPKLFDSSVYWTGYLVSIPFIPLLFTYKPFREAFWKVLRIKTLILYDKPRCGLHR